MLKELSLTNFRGFHNHKLPLRPTTIVVGRNNAGKSTIIEALRLVALVENRVESVRFTAPPYWLDVPDITSATRGIRPSLDGTNIDLSSAFHGYGAPPATIRAVFESGVTITVYIGDDDIFAVIRDKNRIISDKAQARKLDLSSVGILPQISPLLRREKILTRSHIQKMTGSSLSSSHFRNQLHYFAENLPRFKALIEPTWNGVTIADVELVGTYPDGTINVLVRDAGFVAEVAWMGHGLQMWMQTMWFLSLADPNGTVILDEPDVYMHADLQRRLIRMARREFRQIIVATHSVEIMAEVQPEDILVVERTRHESSFAVSLPSVQSLIEKLGGVQNIHVARIWNAKKCIFTEGDDLKLLKVWQDVLFPSSIEPVDAIPNFEIGGWGRWQWALGAASGIKQSIGNIVNVYCIFDCDYFANDVIESRYRDGKAHNVQVHIWTKKEIENYLLVPSALVRCILMRATTTIVPSEADVVAKLDEICEQLRMDVLAAMTNAHYSASTSRDSGKAAVSALDRLNGVWTSTESKCNVVSGKEVLTRLSEWSKSKFGASFGADTVARMMKRDEISSEIVNLLGAIESGSPCVRSAVT